MNGTTTTIDWNGQAVDAWLPGKLVAASISLSPTLIRHTEQAIAALGLMDHQIPVGAEAIGRVLLRSEGVASSAVEGLQVPVEEVLVAEALGEGSRDALWVAGNLAVVAEAVASAESELDTHTLHRWHELLMHDSPLDAELIGRWRRSPGWVGGTSPLDAAYVPPPADAIDSLMGDLIDYINGDSHDPITQAAIAHAQFETIHPYGDGNGRLGRVLIGWVLRRRGVVGGWPPPVSLAISRDAGGYLAGLYEFRHGDPARWVQWFVEIAQRAVLAASGLYESIQELQKGWASALADLRADAAARGAVELLGRYPIIGSQVVMDEIGVSRRSALNALDVLEAKGIVEPYRTPTPRQGRPPRLWIARDLVDIVARAAA